MSSIVEGARPMAKGFAFLKREFLDKRNKADDERITVRIDNDDHWLWGMVSIAGSERGTSLSFSGSTIEEIDASLEKLDFFISILQTFQGKLKDQAEKIKKNLTANK